MTQIVVPRRGVFLLHRRGVPIVADPNTALVYGMGDTYQIGHPVEGGDQCTVLVFRPDILEDALGNVEAQHATIQAATQLSIHVLTHQMAMGETVQLEVEENIVFILNALVTDFRSLPSLSWQRVSEFQKRRIEEVRALLAGQPTHRWHLESIAQAVYCSPFHLARQFRAITGESIVRYLLRLRLTLALDRLAQGETDLAGLALELGFANHSHFSARFRSVFEITPTEARTTLTSRRFQQMSKMLTANPRA